MIKRVMIIGVLTGAAHLSTVIILKQLTGLLPVEDIKTIGEIDAVLNLIVSVLAAGLLTSSVRDIAISENWQPYYINSQRARLTLSLFLCVFFFAGLFSSPYWLIAASPLLALNGDYALYGTGKPVTGSLLAFIRTFVPSAAMLAAALFYPSALVPVFAITSVLTYALSGIVISKILKMPYWIRPSLQSLRLYISSLSLGIVAFSYYFLGLGLIILAGFIYEAAVVAVAYVIIKLTVIFKSVLRIIIQAFISEMTDDEVCNKVDHLAIMAGTIFLLSTVVFPHGFLSLFVDKKIIGISSWIFVIGIIGFFISPFISLNTKATLEKKDRAYAILCAVAIVVSSLICIVLSYISNTETSILVSLGCGEAICTVGLIIILKRSYLIKNRALFIARNLPLLIIPVTIRYWMGDTTLTFILFIALYALVALLVNKNQFRHQASTI